MSGVTTSVAATEDALLTALLHAAKFPSCAIGGALLGPPAAATAARTTIVTAAVPLFHHPTAAMAACVEAGLAQVEALAASRGLALVGYYHAPVHYAAPGPRAAASGVDELPAASSAAEPAAPEGATAAAAAAAASADDDEAARLRSLPPPVRRIAERIAERRPGAVVLAVNNPRLARFSGVVAAAARAGAAAAAAAAASPDDPPCPFDVYAAPAWQRLGSDPPSSPAAPPLRLSEEQEEGGAAAEKAGEAHGAPSSSSWAPLQRRFANALAARLHRRLVDFDEHVDDVSRDYTNPGLLGEATRTLVR